MSETQEPTNRLAYTGNLKSLIERVVKAYGVGTLNSHSVVEVGYEDCNVIIKTDQDKYLAKMFAKTRKPEEITRYTDIMRRVVEAGVSHPELLKTTGGEITHTENDVSLVLMRFIEGETFFELDRAPDENERRAILEQAAKINAIDYEPPYLFDSWAIPNIGAMFGKVKQFIESDDLPLVEQAMTQYSVVPVSELPHAFVHGDFTKTNILKADDGEIYVLDFSVANRYPRIQELAVIVANLLHDKDDTTTLQDRCTQVADEYSQFAELTDQERQHLPAYALAGVAMEFMGAHQEKYISGNDTEETDYWLNLGRNGLRNALA
ncbi:MAG TPA: phosphotransferase [Candidatus Saccharibacteria bacterium]|nr:phosphotransferase [Candidatus Saccharibacteria bacterium]